MTALSDYSNDVSARKPNPPQTTL